MRRSLSGLCWLVLLAGCASTTGVPEPVPPITQDKATIPQFTVVAGGDVLIHPALTEQAEQDGGGRRDYTRLFAGVRTAIDTADLAICHLEVPLAGADGPFEEPAGSPWMGNELDTDAVLDAARAARDAKARLTLA